MSDSEQARNLYYSALDLLDQRDYAQAYRKLVQLQSEYPGSVENGFVEMHLGHCCYHLAGSDFPRYEEGLEYLQVAHKTIDKDKYGFEYAKICDLLGDTLWFLERNEEARGYLEDGLPYLNEFNPDWKAYYLLVLSRVLRYLGDYDQALSYLQIAKESIEQAKDSGPLKSEWYLEMGWAYYRKGEFDLADPCLAKIEPDLLPKWQRSYLFTLQLVVYSTNKRYHDAIEAFCKEEQEGVDERSGAQLLWLAGYSAFQIGNYKQAMDWFQRSDSYPTDQAWIRSKSREYQNRIRLEHPDVGT